MKRKDLSPDENSAGTRPPTTTAPSKQSAIAVSPSRDEVARRAYAIYLDQGSPPGRDVQHWLEAETQALKARKADRGKRLDVIVKRKRRGPVHNIENDLPKQVQAKSAASLRDRLAEAVELMILPADETAVGPGVFLPQARVRPVASLVSSIKLITERASTTTKVPYEIHERYYASSHWGINE